MVQIKYVAKKQFKYNGKVYETGDEWTPGGGNYDAQVKEFLVNQQEITKRPARRKRGTSSK